MERAAVPAEACRASWSQVRFWKLMAGVQVEDICSFCSLCLNSLLRPARSLLCSRQSS